MGFFSFLRGLVSSRFFSAEARTIERDVAREAAAISEAAVKGPVESIFGRTSVSISSEGSVLMNGVPAGEIETMMRAGRLNAVVDRLGISGAESFTRAEEKAFSSSVREFPETHLRDVDDAVSTGKTAKPELDVSDTSNLNAAQRKEVEEMINKTKAAKGGSATKTIAGVFLKVSGGALVYLALNDLCHQRNGCWLVITERQSGHTQAYKIAGASCGNSPTSAIYYNVATDDMCRKYGVYPSLYATLVYYATVGGSRYDEIVQAVGYKYTAAMVPVVIGNTTDYKALDTLVAEYRKNELNVSDVIKCTAATGCINCDSTASKATPEFIDISDMPDNATIMCKTGSTVFDVIGDLADDAADAIINSDPGKRVSAVCQNMFKYLVIGALLIAVVGIVIKLVFMAKPKDTVAAPAAYPDRPPTNIF